MLSWFKHRRRKPVGLDPRKEAEKRSLQAELSQSVMTFERRRHGVNKIAEQAVNMMKGDSK